MNIGLNIFTLCICCVFTSVTTAVLLAGKYYDIPFPQFVRYGDINHFFYRWKSMDCLTYNFISTYVHHIDLFNSFCIALVVSLCRFLYMLLYALYSVTSRKLYIQNIIYPVYSTNYNVNKNDVTGTYIMFEALKMVSRIIIQVFVIELGYCVRLSSSIEVLNRF